jgi:replication factor A1
MVQLTAGSCYSLYNADPSNDKLFDIPHTLQVLSIKKVNVPGDTGNAVERYRIIISDGISFMQAMLATQLNSMVHDNSIGKHTVIVVDKLTCNFLQGKRYATRLLYIFSHSIAQRLIILLALHPIETPPDKIGDPKSLMDQDHGTTSANAGHVQQSSSTPITPQPQVDNAPKRQQASSKGGRPIFPIEGLSPYQNNWTIKARVTQKSEIKTWSNQRGEGKLFNVTLMDDTGEIKGTGFNLVVDELYPKLEEGKVYYISKARVNLAKKKFSNLANDYELSFERSTEVEEVSGMN